MSRVLADWSVVLLVLAAAAIGLTFAGPGRTLVDWGAINVVLFVLVLAAAMTLPTAALTSLRRQVPSLLAVSAVVLVALPALAWAAAHLVPEGPARFGVLALAVAPAEIATVAFTASARGATASAAFLLLVSTVVTAVIAAPVLGLLAGGGSVRAGELVVTVVVVVLVPFALGLGLRLAVGDRVEAGAERVATGAVIVLVGLVATQVTLDATFGRVLLALLVFLVGGVVVGVAVSRTVSPSDRSAVVLSVSMRDFAVASGIAAAAFGPAAAAPLGLYGVIVMIWGSVLVTIQRQPDDS